jgi:non-ribosomal peptide synthase protein (TIGR01720 family)
VQVTLLRRETEELLHKLPSYYKARVDDLLLTALAEAVAAWSGQRQLLVDLESHGRQHGFEELDLSRTVGWLTVLYPAFLELESSADPGQRLRSIRDGLRAIPRGGLPWGLMRHGPWEEQLAALPQAEISFNYLGRLDLSAAASEFFAPAPEQLSGTRSGRARRRHMLEVNAAISGSQLELAWTFSEKIHRQTTIERLTQGFLSALRTLIANTHSPAARSYRPTDFPTIELDQSKLDKILQKVKAK